MIGLPKDLLFSVNLSQRMILGFLTVKKLFLTPQSNPVQEERKDSTSNAVED